MKPRLTTDEYYDLVLLATGSRKLAEQKAKARRAALMAEKLDPT